MDPSDTCNPMDHKRKAKAPKSEREGQTTAHPRVTPSAVAPLQDHTDPLAAPKCRPRPRIAREVPQVTKAKRGAPVVVTNVVGVVTGVAGRRGSIVKTKKATVTAAGVAGHALAIRASQKCKASTAIDYTQCKAPSTTSQQHSHHHRQYHTTTAQPPPSPLPHHNSTATTIASTTPQQPRQPLPHHNSPSTG